MKQTGGTGRARDLVGRGSERLNVREGKWRVHGEEQDQDLAAG